MTSKASLKNKRILITCGPTWVPIDRIRILSNILTGELGRVMAADFKKAGARVTMLAGPMTPIGSGQGMRVLNFQYYQQLRQLLRQELKKKYDVVVHAAAVSDYQLKRPLKNKVPSGLSSLKLDLVPTAKLIDEIKRLNPNVFLIGFKLTPDKSTRGQSAKVRALFKKSGCDLVIVNHFQKNQYAGYILNRTQKVLGQGRSRRGMARQLIKIVKAQI